MPQPLRGLFGIHAGARLLLTLVYAHCVSAETSPVGPAFRGLSADQEVVGRFSAPAAPAAPVSESAEGEPVHLYRLPAAEGKIPWRLVVRQEGLEVRVVERRGGLALRSLNFHLDRYEEEVFRLSAEATSFEIRPLAGSAAEGSYRLRLERPAAEPASRRRLEMQLSEAASVEHGADAEAVSRAAEIFEEVAGELATGGDPGLKARALLGAANHRRVLGDGERAAAHYAEAIVTWRRLEEPGWLAVSLLGLGQSVRRLGRLDEARDALLEAAELWRALPGRAFEAAVTEGSLGLLAHIRGEYDGALGHYRAAFERHRQAGREKELANISLNLGSLYAQIGDAEKALHHQETSLGVFRRLGDRRGELDTLNSLALLHARMAEYEPALALHGRSRQLAAQLGDARLEGRALNNRGWIYLGLGDFERAAADFELAHRLALESGDGGVEIAALSNLAEASSHLGQVREARRHWLAALAKAKELEHRKEMEILAQLGRVEVRLGDGDGEPRFAAARALHASRGNLWEAAFLDTLHGEARLARGAAAGALELLDRAFEAWRELGDETGQILVLIAKGRAERRLGELQAARVTLLEAVERVERLRVEMAGPKLRASFLAARLDAHELLIDTLVDLDARQPSRGHLEAALAISERARARRFLDLLGRAEGDPGDPASAKLDSERRRLARRLALLLRRRELVTLGRQRPRDGEDLDAAVSDTRARLDVLEARIHGLEPRGSTATAEALGVEQMRRLLDPDTLVLQYALGESRSHLFVLAPQGLQHAALPPRAEIEAAVARAHWAWSVLGGPADEDRKAAAELGPMLLPDLPLLSDPTFKRLAIVPDGALHYLPSAPLPHPTHGRALIESHELLRLSSLSTLGAARQKLAPAAGGEGRVILSVLADPVFDAGDPRLPRSGEPSRGKVPVATVRGVPSYDALRAEVALGRLPGSGAEARAIATHLPAPRRRLALGFDADHGALRHAAENSVILHLATHGLVDTEDPELSGLALSRFHADGRRRQDAFAGLFDISQLHVEAELVVLSGCRTALGKAVRGESLQGLATGFVRAGARRVLSSLWAVADRATVQLMDDFYRGLLVDGLAPASALRGAQLEMAADRRYADPYYWAGFAIRGDWRPMTGLSSPSIAPSSESGPPARPPAAPPRSPRARFHPALAGEPVGSSEHERRNEAYPNE